MKKKDYVRPRSHVIILEGMSLMAGSDKYGVDVDGKEEIPGGSKEENPDDIDAKTTGDINIWDDEY